MSPRHLVNIIMDYELAEENRAALNQRSAAALIELIVRGVRDEIEKMNARR